MDPLAVCVYGADKSPAPSRYDTMHSCNAISADTLRDLVTLTFWPWSVVTHAGHVVNPSSLKIIRLSILELWVLTSLIWYHWQCVCSHCACAVLRDLWLGANFSRIFEIPDPDLPIRYATFMALRLRQRVISQNSVWPCAKDHTTFCACAKSRQRSTLL